MIEFQNEYLQVPTLSRVQIAQRELAAHCSDLIDAYEDQRCRYHLSDGGIPVTPEERADCRQYAREVNDELFRFASLLGPLELREWNQLVLEETRRKNNRERKQ